MANAVDPRTPAGETPVSTETARAPTAARRYADKDPLDRQALADALADELYGHAIGPKDIDPGPTVVTIERPWGSGKSTLMDLVRKQLPDPPRSTASPRRLTVRMASRQLRDGPVEQPPGAETKAPERMFTIYYGVATGEAAALSAVDAVGAQVYSLGQVNTDGSPFTAIMAIDGSNLTNPPIGPHAPSTWQSRDEDGTARLLAPSIRSTGPAEDSP